MSAGARGLLLALAVGCAAVDDDAPADTDTDTDTDLPDCGPAGEVTEVATGFSGGTEGIAVSPDGTVYVVAKDRLVTVAEDGTVTDVAPLPSGVGAAWFDGAVWVAVWEDDAGEEAGALLEITPSGEVTRHDTPTIAKPNFLLPTSWGTLLVSDDFDTRIFEVDGDEVTVWTEGVPSPNGMGLSPDDATLWVANTFTDDPPLQAIPLRQGVVFGPIQDVHAYPTASFPDGLLVAADGTVLVAVNGKGEVHAWDGSDDAVVASEVTTVASLAWNPWDPTGCSVLATKLLQPDVVAVQVGTRGP